MAKKTGLVFTGGGLRGICGQTGGLLALAERGCRFDAVIGTSAGSVLGAMYALGKTAPEIRELVTSLTRDNYLDPISPRKLLRAVKKRLRGFTGYYRGEAMLAWLRQSFAPVTRIEDCKLPFHVTVTNVSRGAPQIKSEGPLAEFVCASSSVPLVFRLQEIEGEYYADGGAVNNVPGDELVKLCPHLEQLLILTALSPWQANPPPDNGFLTKSWTPLRAVRRIIDAIRVGQKLDNLNVGDRKVEILRIAARDIDFDEFDKIGECIEQGYENASQQIENGDVDLSEIPRDDDGDST